MFQIQLVIQLHSDLDTSRKYCSLSDTLKSNFQTTKKFLKR
jgi:hypothetical protein